jgi:SAM-dependent methyltransferase
LKFGFPLFRDRGTPWEALSPSQLAALERFMQKLETGEYLLVENRCLCAGQRPETDLLLSEVDRYGLPFPTRICHNCGILRSAVLLDEPSTRSFYEHDYRSIYGECGQPTESFLKDQSVRGTRLAELFFATAGGVGAEGLRVFEIGCGAGGVLLPFLERGCTCSGCDFNEEYLAFGRSRGLDLRSGTAAELLADESQDLIIMSHVLEHFANPIDELARAVAKLKPGGRIIIEVPGVFSIHKVYYSPIFYLQNAHVYGFFAGAMRELLSTVGLEPVYLDETVIAIAVKPANWRPPEVRHISVSRLESSFARVAGYLLASHWLYKMHLNPYRLITALSATIKRR